MTFEKRQTRKLCLNMKSQFLNDFPKVFVGNSLICPSLGLFAGQNFEIGDIISIYSGEKLQDDEAEMRGLIQDAIEETYLFTLDEVYSIDAS